MTVNGKPRKDVLVLDAVERFEKPLTGYALRLVGGDLHAARDVVQHAFLQLCKQPPGKVNDRLAPWLYSVCRNRAFDLVRKRKRQKIATDAEFNSLSSAQKNPAEHVESEDFLRSLKLLFDCLSEPERDVIELWSRGLATGEIADVLNKKSGSVRVSLHRAIKRLKQQPEIKKWLERATGHSDRREAESRNGSVSKLKPIVEKS